MKKIMKVAALFIASFAIIFSSTIKVVANEDATFSVSIATPDSQTDKSLPYFDLITEPGKKEDLILIVSNTGKKEKKIEITPIDAFTNQDGQIDYSIRSKELKNDSTLKHPFTSLVGKKQTINIKPGKTEKVTFKLKMPKEKISGTILGGFVTNVLDEDEDSKGVIKNKFQLNHPVIINEDSEITLPELKLNKIQVQARSDVPGITANIQNTKPAMFSEMTIKSSIIDSKTGKTIREQENSNLEMAPNSNFDFPIHWYNTVFKEGNYELQLAISSGDMTWELTDNFEITEENKRDYLEYLDSLENGEKMSLFSIFLIILLILFVTAFLGGVLFYYLKKKGLIKFSLKRNKKKQKRKK